MQYQHTLKNAIEIKGIGLHSGCAAVMTIEPAPEITAFGFNGLILRELKRFRHCILMSLIQGIVPA